MMKAEKCIKIWMFVKGLNARSIADKYGSTEQFVGQFLKGRKTSKGLVGFFIDKGCPKIYFKNGRVAA